MKLTDQILSILDSPDVSGKVATNVAQVIQDGLADRGIRQYEVRCNHQTNSCSWLLGKGIIRGEIPLSPRRKVKFAVLPWGVKAYEVEI
jgi:hypothetical protein